LLHDIPWATYVVLRDTTDSSITAPAIDKLDVYRGLGVREVWVFTDAKFQVFALTGDHYEASAASRVFPEVDLDRIAHYAAQGDQHSALQAFRAELRGN
jgi:hypothetical protein